MTTREVSVDDEVVGESVKADPSRHASEQHEHLVQHENSVICSAIVDHQLELPGRAQAAPVEVGSKDASRKDQCWDDWEQASKLQRPLPDGSLKTVATGEKENLG